MVSLETQSKIAELREKVRTGTATQDDMREGIRLLRADRLAMPAAKIKTPAINGDDLLKELGL